MKEGIKTVWVALKSSLKIRAILAFTFLSAYFWMKSEVIVPESQKNLYFWFLIVLLLLGFLFLISIVFDAFIFLKDRWNKKKKQKDFERNFRLLKGDELRITQEIWNNKKRSVILGEDDPWTISLEDKGIIEKADPITPEYSIFGTNKKYEYRLTRKAVKAILKDINSNSNN